MTIRSVLRACAVAGILLMVSLIFAPPVHAATSTSPAFEPSWWHKFQVVSSPGFRAISGSTSSAAIAIGPNVDVSHERGPQSETSVAINSQHPRQIVGGANEIARLPMRGFFSSDGGKHWGGVDLPLPPNPTNSQINFGSDPGVAWDTLGNVYYSYIVVFFNQNFAAVTATEMAVARSSDGGMSWTPTYFGLTTGTARFNDKPMITVDDSPSSPFVNTVYAAWDRVSSGDSSHNNILVSRSTDHGLKFSQPVVATTTPGGHRGFIGADPFVGPDGTLFVAWHDFVISAIEESSSTDGGRTFGPTHTIAATAVPFDVSIPSMSFRRALVYPACAADTSHDSFRGTLYCSWMDETATNGAEIFFARSTNGGVAWTGALRVNDDPTGIANDQFNQWLALDPTTGTIVASWDDTRADPAHLSTNIFYAQSTDGGHSFSPNVKVTTAPTNEAGGDADLGNQYGDYEGIAAFGGLAQPIWTDRRASVVALDEEVFTATVTE